VVTDVLSKLGSKRALVPAWVFVQDLSKLSIKLLDLDNLDLVQHDLTWAPPRDVLMTEKEDDWRVTPGFRKTNQEHTYMYAKI
jgi:hypothetical protein